MSFVSKLKQILEEYSPKQAEAQTVDEALQFLKARGVKDAELEFSGFDQAMKDFGDAFTLEDMLQMEGRRPDLFALSQRDDGDMQYGGVRLGSKDPRNATPTELADENYREWNYQFMNHPWQDEPAYSRSASHHFEEVPSYLGHIRTTDDIIDNNPVLNIQELQSDVLGTKKSLAGGHGISLEMDQLDDIQAILENEVGPGGEIGDAHGQQLRDIATEVFDATGHDINAMDDFQTRNFFRDGFTPVGSGLIPKNAAKGPGPMDFPNKKNYYQRMVERILGVAEDEGKDIVVPLKDTASKLPPDPSTVELFDDVFERLEEVKASMPLASEKDAWYSWIIDPYVTEDLTNATGLDIRSMDEAQLRGLQETELKPKGASAIGTIDHGLYRGNDIQKRVYDPAKGQVPKALKKVAREQDMQYDTFEKDGVMYGRIKRGGKKKKPTELYSMGGLLTPAILNQILQDPSQDVR